MILGLDHIAIAVPELERAIKRFCEDFQLQHTATEAVTEAQTMTAFFPVGETQIELISPLADAGPVASSLKKRGPGLHHICFRSDDILADMARLQAKGYRFTTQHPTPGAHGSQVAFIHPKDTEGVLIELNQAAGD